MTIAAIIVGLVLAFLAFRFVRGVIKFGVLALIAVVILWFLMDSGAR